MASDALNEVLGRIDEATNSLAAVLADLRDKVKTGMSAAEVEAVKGKLSQVESRLTGLASDPDTPVPPGPEVEPLPA